MSDDADIKEEVVQPVEPEEEVVLPPQTSATDTSNWENRDFTTPSGRVIIETDQTDPDGEIIAE